MYCNLIVTRPFNQVFTYDTGNTKVKKGQIAIVPFGKSIEVGMIVEINVSKYKKYLNQIHNAGSIMIGKYSPMAVSDYNLASNNVLPQRSCANKYRGETL